jgi:hypothetical protein
MELSPKRNRNKSFVEFFLGEFENIDNNYESAVLHHKKAVELAKKSEFQAVSKLNSILQL